MPKLQGKGIVLLMLALLCITSATSAYVLVGPVAWAWVGQSRQQDQYQR